MTEKSYQQALIQIDHAKRDRLSVLHLNGYGLTALPPEIASLTDLEALYLDQNELTSLPPELGLLTRLRTLSLSDNLFTAFPPEVFALTALQELYFDENQLTSVPSEIGALSALQELYLQDNQLSALPFELAALTELQALHLDNNNFAAFPPAIARLAALRTLSLSDNQLTTLPPEIGGLTSLEMLYFEDNQLTSLPPEIAALTALEALYLDNNELTALPAQIASLAALQELHLSFNQVTSLPPQIAGLTSLRVLHARRNLLINLPPEIGALTCLQVLSLRENQLASLPPEIAGLARLQTLTLSENQLTNLPPEIAALTDLATLNLSHNQLTVLPAEIGELAALQTLHLQSNQLTSLPLELTGLTALKHLFLHENDGLQIPSSVLGPAFREGYGRGPSRVTPARPADILNFYFARRSASVRGVLQAISELKVMLVGRGGAGKTSLRRFFLNQPHDAKEPETPGIALDDFELSCHKRKVVVHLWDFAGQEITHALHQFFLTEGCVYIVVLDPRSNTEMTDAFYWLDQLKRYAPGAPVIVALNRQDARQGGYDVDRDLLKERYPQIRDFVKTNCSTRSGCVDLRARLIETIEILEPTEPPRLKVPADWLRVKDACWHIATGREKKGRGGRAPRGGAPRDTASAGRRKHTLTFQEFGDICARHGITDRDGQESLARLLHKLGAVLHFVDDPRLRDMSVLNPHWVTDGVYRLLRYKDRPESDGILTITEAAEALDDKSEQSARYLLGLMERFEMCFPLEEDAPAPVRWLIPGALNPYQPSGIGQRWNAPGAVRLRYDYGSPVAEGILPRFIVLTHPLKDKTAVWRNGVVLRDGEAAAMVRRGEKTNYVEVAAFGPEATRLRLLELIQGTMSRVNADLPGKPPLLEKEMDGLPGGLDGVYKSVADLRAAELAQTPIVVGTTPPPVLIQAKQQLDRMSEQASRDPERVPLRTFLSYSHADRRVKNIFAQNLAVMQGRNLVSAWHDGMIETGKDWKKEIDGQLESMDLFVGLLTTSFLASSFIQKVELKAARERLLDRHRRDFLFVLIVVDENLSIEGLDLGQYQLLYPGGKAISQYSKQSAFFNQAQKEIEALIKQHKFKCDGSAEPHERIEPPPRLPVDQTSGVTVIVQGDYFSGGKQMSQDNSIKIGGSVVNSQVGQNLINCTNMIQQQAPGPKRDLLEELQSAVEELIKRLPEEKKAEVPQIVENLELAVKQATKDKPDRKWYSISSEGLLEAAGWVNDFSGKIGGTLKNLGSQLWPDFDLPKIGG